MKKEIKVINTTKKPGIRELYNKGWAIKTHHSKNRNSGYVAMALDKKTNKYEYVALKRTQVDAVKAAISEAFKRKTLNWDVTKRWLYENKIGISFDDVLDVDWQNYRCGKGWFIVKKRRKYCYSYACRIGARYDDVKSVGSKSSLKIAAKHAITAAKNEPYYNQAATIYWLQQNDLLELIEIV